VRLTSLQNLYVAELKDLYDAESRIIKALPKMADAAQAPDLHQAFGEHLEQTRGHVDRLARIFEMLREAPKGQKCKGIEGILDEGKEIIDRGEDAPPSVNDAGLIAAVQRVEHHEIAAYGTARSYARRLGHEDQARLLDQTLQEEGNADKRLTQLAELSINEQAKAAR
jgi:ferritin-like metal-binding protein YciE